MDVRMLIGALDDFGGGQPVLIQDDDGTRRYATIEAGSVNGVPVVILSPAGRPIVGHEDLDEADD